MASEVDICNLALAHLGDDANVSAIDPSDGSAQADHCVRYYPIARDQLLALHAWGFATKRVSLALIETDELPVQWQFCYARPANCINIISVLPVATADSVFVIDPLNPLYSEPTRPGDTDTQDYVQEVLQDGTQVILCNTEDAIARYVAGVTDTTKFTPLFVTACARLLAGYLAGPILKGTEGMAVSKEQYGIFVKVDLPLAVTADQRGQKVNVYRNFVPDAFQMRR